MLLRIAALACALACGTPAPPPQQCVPPRPAGDLAQPVELLAVAVDAQGTLHALHDGDTLLLQKPSQGGFVLYAGAAARNLEACGANISAQLLDPAGGPPITGLDIRGTDFTVASSGYFWPANGFTGTANIPSCPDALHRGVVGRSAVLHVEVTDANQRKGSVEVKVTPVCAQGDGSCACLCGPNPSSC